MLCHKSPLKSLAINQTGNYMITSGLDHLLNVWDLRTYKQLRSVRLSAGAATLSFSQKDMISAGLKNQVVVLSPNVLKTQSRVIIFVYNIFFQFRNQSNTRRSDDIFSYFVVVVVFFCIVRYCAIYQFMDITKLANFLVFPKLP